MRRLLIVCLLCVGCGAEEPARPGDDVLVVETDDMGAPEDVREVVPDMNEPLPDVASLPDVADVGALDVAIEPDAMPDVGADMLLADVHPDAGDDASIADVVIDCAAVGLLDGTVYAAMNLVNNGTVGYLYHRVIWRRSCDPGAVLEELHVGTQSVLNPGEVHVEFSMPTTEDCWEAIEVEIRDNGGPTLADVALTAPPTGVGEGVWRHNDPPPGGCQ